MIHLRNSPMLWLAFVLLFSYGITEKLAPVPAAAELALACFALLCGFAAALKYGKGSPYIPTVAVSMLALAAGALRISGYTRTVYAGDPLPDALYMQGELVVNEVLKRKAQGISLQCKVIWLHEQDTTDLITSFGDRYMLVQVREADSLFFLPGDMIRAEGWVSAIAPPLNPHAFDLRRHYHTISIRHRMTVKGLEITVLPGARFSVMRLPARWQYALSSIVHRHTSAEVAQLTNALVWGDRSDMDQDIIDAFALSGAMHVLSVSGMHVAIIYSMLYVLLGAPGKGSFRRRMIRLAVYAAAILLYMALTGASAAVVRAGWMIILFITGKAMGWNTQTWNILGFSACLMLWMDPFIRHNIGFQLSYLAMAGLLLYTQPVTRYLSFKNRLLQWTWEITAVSIAAQIFIVPLLLSYFHQFPLTFMLSSLVAVPAGYIIIFGTLLNVGLSAAGINALWPISDKAGEYFILSMKWMAEMNPQMNYAMPSPAGILLMLMPVLFSMSLIYTWPMGRKIAYGCGVCGLLIFFVHRTIQWNHDELLLYHTYNGILADVIIDGHCFSVRDSIVTPQAARFAAHGHRSYRDVIQVTELSATDKLVLPRCRINAEELWSPSISVLLMSDSTDITTASKKFTYVIIRQCDDHKKTLALLAAHMPEVIILPAHIRGYGKYAITKFAAENEIAVHDISKQGYFKLEL